MQGYNEFGVVMESERMEAVVEAETVEKELSEHVLLDKIAKLNRLIERPGTAGEGRAAQEGRRRMSVQLAALLSRKYEVLTFKFRMDNPWKKKLFKAVVERYGLQLYRNTRQRKTTCMLRAPDRLQRLIWSEFMTLARKMDLSAGDILKSLTEKL